MGRCYRFLHSLGCGGQVESKQNADVILMLSPLGHFFLQDQYDRLAVHTQKGIEFLDRYGNFIKDRSAIENEYASKLR